MHRCSVTLIASSNRFLAIVLPTLTLCTHTLLALSFALPGNEQYRASWSLTYNVIAAGASILGLIGAVRVSRIYALFPILSLSYLVVVVVSLKAGCCFVRTKARPVSQVGSSENLADM